MPPPKQPKQNKQAAQNDPERIEQYYEYFGIKQPQTFSFELILEDIDEIVKLLFGISKLNPDFFFAEYNRDDIIQILNQQNKHSVYPKNN